VVSLLTRLDDLDWEDVHQRVEAEFCDLMDCQSDRVCETVLGLLYQRSAMNLRWRAKVRSLVYYHPTHIVDERGLLFSCRRSL
jgi:hypothetical protein